jgi:S-formylglutathione hydrolase FrmB
VMRDISLAGWWPVGTLLLALGVAMLALGVAVARRARWRVPAVLVSVVLLLASAGQAVNAHYAYYPNLAEALGGTAPDDDSLAAAEAGAATGVLPANGQVVTVDLPGTTSGFAARQALVYLPPAWSARPRPALPVLLLLHGTPGDPSNWTEGGAAQTTTDAWAAQHSGMGPVLVMPDINGSLTGDTECVDSPLGNVETYLTVDVPATVQRLFGTAPPGKQWAVAGLSEGGVCSIMLALRHPALFPTFGDYSGLLGPRLGDDNADTADTVTELFGGSPAQFQAHEPAALLAAQRFPGLGGWFQVGADDTDPVAAAQQLVPLATAAGISTCLVVMPGLSHTFDVWSAAYRDSLPWMAARTGLVAPSPDQTAVCQRPSG